MDPVTAKTVAIDGAGGTAIHPVPRSLTTLPALILDKLGLMNTDADYHLLRAAMVTIFFFFG
jgi:hypothetical protein